MQHIHSSSNEVSCWNKTILIY